VGVLAGGLGSAARYLIGQWARTRSGSASLTER
jgi:hypothetical protein